MAQQFQAVYESGVLRPVDPLHLEEHQLVSVILLDNLSAENDLVFEDPARFAALADPNMTLEAVREALSRIPGSMDADYRAEREEQCPASS